MAPEGTPLALWVRQIKKSHKIKSHQFPILTGVSFMKNFEVSNLKCQPHLPAPFSWAAGLKIKILLPTFMSGHPTPPGRQAGGRAGRRAGGQAGRQTDRQTDALFESPLNPQGKFLFFLNFFNNLTFFHHS